MTPVVEVDVCIVGAGPAGMLLGTLLASRGIKTLVLEKNDTFEREFRGEVLQPRFSMAVDQIGLKDFLFSRPCEQFSKLNILSQGQEIAQFALDKINPDYPYVLWMTQPEMLRAFQEKAEHYEAFDLWFHARCEDLIDVGGRIVGARVQHGDDKKEIRAKLVVGCDGRNSTVVKKAKFESDISEHVFDVMWFQVERPEHLEKEVSLCLSKRHNYIILPKFPNLIQCGLMVTPGQIGSYRKKGIEAIKNELRMAHPLFHPFADSLERYTEFHILQAKLSHRKSWSRDGLLLVGDAAHTCSPIGAVGVSVAIETAIVAADVIIEAHKEQDFSSQRLGEVQKRRDPNVRKVLKIQSLAARQIGNNNPILNSLRPLAIRVAGALGLFPVLAAQLLGRSEPLPISSDLRLD